MQPLGQEGSWMVSMEGRVRQRVSVAVVLRPDRVSFYFFMVRAPRENQAQFYHLLLRKNLRTFAMKYCLDADGDVWLVAELPRSGFDAGELDRILGVFHQESESAFEALVHLGYPGVFAPLPSPPWRGPGGPRHLQASRSRSDSNRVEPELSRRRPGSFLPGPRL